MAPIAPPAISPSAVAPPITPGELLLAGARIDGVCGNIGNRLANGGQPFGNRGTVRSRQLRVRWILRGIARRGGAEQQGHADRAGRHDLRKNPEVFLPQRHPTPPLMGYCPAEFLTKPLPSSNSDGRWCHRTRPRPRRREMEYSGKDR